MKLFIYLFTLLTIYSCNSKKDVIVKHKGALYNIMHKGDLSAKVDLNEFESRDGLYGIGAVENLKGEILILDGVSYVSFCEMNDSLKVNTIKKTFDVKATLLVYSQVKNWIDIKIPLHVKSYKQFEDFVISEAIRQGLDTETPFPFLIDGEFDSFDWHVIDWKKGDLEHSHDKHIQAGLNGTKQNSNGIVLGFYSNKHHSIYTHHTTNMHLHIKTDNNDLVGHVDDLIIGNRAILRLPISN